MATIGGGGAEPVETYQSDSNQDVNQNAQPDSTQENNQDTSDSIKDLFRFFCRGNANKEKVGSMLTAVDAMDYCMQHGKRGKCVIFNHEKFGKFLRPFPLRTGSKHDVKALGDCFTAFGFEVVVHTDLKCSRITEELKKVAASNDDVDCLVVIVLTHSEQGFLMASDKPYDLESLFEYFNGEKCIQLAGKPKIFIVQSCEGDKVNVSEETKVAKDVADSCGTHRIPTWADFILLHSTIPGYLTWNNSEKPRGSFVIERLAASLKQYAHTLDLLTIFTLVNREAYSFFSISWQEKNLKKPPVYIRHTLTRRIFLRCAQQATAV